MLRVQGSGFRVQGAGCRVQGSGFRVQGSGFRVHLEVRVGREGVVRDPEALKMRLWRHPPHRC